MGSPCVFVGWADDQCLECGRFTLVLEADHRCPGCVRRAAYGENLPTIDEIATKRLAIEHRSAAQGRRDRARGRAGLRRRGY